MLVVVATDGSSLLLQESFSLDCIVVQATQCVHSHSHQSPERTLVGVQCTETGAMRCRTWDSRIRIWDYLNASIVYAYPTLDAALAGVRREVDANGPDVARTWFLQKDDGNEIEIIAEEDDLVAMAQKQRLSAV